jgi:hypothetical protein
MLSWNKSRLPIAMGIGLAVGLVLSGFWPHTPLHAVSTDRADTYAMATGPVDVEVEAVYLLDFLTGDLGAIVLGKQPGSWTGFFKRNVLADLAVDPQKNPKFMMVTGMAALRRTSGTHQQPSSAACYVAEITSGKVVAYAIPWNPNRYAAGQVQNFPLAVVGPPIRFRQTAAGIPGTGSGVAVPKAKEGKGE